MYRTVLISHELNPPIWIKIIVGKSRKKICVLLHWVFLWFEEQSSIKLPAKMLSKYPYISQNGRHFIWKNLRMRSRFNTIFISISPELNKCLSDYIFLKLFAQTPFIMVLFKLIVCHRIEVTFFCTVHYTYLLSGVTFRSITHCYLILPFKN